MKRNQFDLSFNSEIEEVVGLQLGVLSPEQIEKDCDRDFFMSPEEAKEYGVIDEILWPGES